MKQFCAFFVALFAAHVHGGNELLAVGSAAPEFSLVSSNGDTVKLLDFRDRKNVVLVFYPGDQTPGCTKQLCALRDDYSAFDKKDVIIFAKRGMPPDSEILASIPVK